MACKMDRNPESLADALSPCNCPRCANDRKKDAEIRRLKNKVKKLEKKKV
jgi:hypothetical protein